VSNVNNGYGADYFFFGGYENGPVFYPRDGVTVYNPRSGDTQKRWVENTDKAGLRETDLDCQGWFCDEWQYEIAQGVVYRLPARNGESRFVAGIKDPCNDGAALVDFDIFTDERGAINNANRMAENYADEQRRACEQDRREQRCEELRGDISDALKRGIAIIQDAKKIRKALCETTALRDMLSASIADLRDNITEMRRELVELSE